MSIWCSGRCSPNQAIDYKTDLKVLAAQQWPTVIPEADFKRVTGAAGFPPELRAKVVNGSLQYDCNTLVSYTVRGVHATLNAIWDWEAPPGALDRHYAVYRGSKAAVEVRQTKADKYQAEVYVDSESARGSRGRSVLPSTLGVAALQADYPGRESRASASEIHILIPDRFRDGHEAHFARVTRNFLRYLRDRSQAAQLGAAEHGGEVLRDDDRNGVEPRVATEGGAAAGARVMAATDRYVGPSFSLRHVHARAEARAYYRT